MSLKDQPLLKAKCRVCGKEGEHESYTPREMQFGTRQSFDYFRCSQCQCLQILEIPEDLSEYYPNQYYSTKAIKEKRYTGLRGSLWKQPFKASMKPSNLWLSLLHWLKPVPHFACLQKLQLEPESRILDIGCGNGKHFLYPLRKLGFQNVQGCDPFIEGDIFYENGLKIFKSSVEVLATKGEKFDFVFLHHSYEHVVNPLETLQAIDELLSDKGVCVIRVPVSSSWAWEHYGVNWYQLDAPRHLYLHSVKSLKVLADKVGLKCEQVVHDSNYLQIFASDNYAKDIALVDMKKGKGIKWQLERSKMNQKAKELNEKGQGDQAVFYLKKGC